MSYNKLMIIYPPTNNHLGLWKDLEDDERCYLRCTKWKKVSNIIAYFQYYYFQLYKRFNWLPFHFYWLEYFDLYKKAKSIDHLIIIDGALNTLKLSELKKCKKINPSLDISLYLINAIGASSPILKKVRPKIENFNWDNIYTFDPVEAKKFNFNYLGFNYYSSHLIEKSNLSQSDVFFVGGLKGGRTELIYNLYTRLSSCGVKCDFYLMPIDNKNIKHLSGIYYFNGWRPYEEILQHTQKTRCIIEIIQEGQSGATLRYFEAVTMNKKLLTNNPNIAKFPFYNPKWMKIFKSIDDIDVNWINDEESVEYGYTDEFSPRYLVDFMLST